MEYNISEAYAGGDGLRSTIDNFAKKWVGGHYLISFVVIIVLVIVVLWLIVRGGKEGLGVAKNVERDDRFVSSPGNITGSVGVLSQNYDPTIPPGQPGSFAYQVLNDPSYGCNTDAAQKLPNDIWSELVQEANKEELSSKPTTDQLAAIAYGQK